ncbi:MAG: 1-acyl-sn-glycerol-3-phosphate acyltransferase [Eubacterium sp.]|nr:1-acyl-sn-glycerol-3-phosphate acyltransferase [Eubacterium sp.]
MIRFILCALWAFFGMVFSLPLHFRYKRMIKKDPMKGWTKAFPLVQGFFRKLLFFAGTKVTVKGLENIPEDQAVLFVGNHRSYFDIIILHTLVKKPLAFISKKEFEHTPLLSPYQRDIGCVFLDRENPREAIKTINEATERIKLGLSMGLYPEGTRNHSDTLLPFKEGGYKMAERAKAPIVLVAMTGQDDIFENNKFHLIKKSHVQVEFSEPVNPSEMTVPDKKAYYADIPNRITKMLEDQKNNKDA